MTDWLDNNADEKTLPAPLTIHPAPLTLRQWTDEFQARLWQIPNSVRQHKNSNRVAPHPNPSPLIPGARGVKT